MKFADIKQFPHSCYRINVDLDSVKRTLEGWDERSSFPDGMLVLNPEWQRGHVWTKKQKISFVEYFLRGGSAGKEIYFNCSSWMGNFNTKIYCVDGLQRISAALDFLDNKFPVYGSFYKDYEDSSRVNGSGFFFNMLKIRGKKELLSVYLDFNSGGTPHNKKELDRVAEMINNCPDNETL